MLTADEARRAATRDWGRVLDALGSLDAAGWARPTRCTGWTLIDLARHGAWGTSMEADALRRARTGEPGTAEGTEPAGGPDEVLAALRRSVADLGAELDHAPDLPGDAVVTLPFGPLPAAFALHVFAMEAGVHADDVADALARDEPLADDVVDATGTVLAAVLPVLAAASGEAPPADTVVLLSGPTTGLRFAHGVGDAGGWAVVGEEVPPTATVVGADDSAVLRFALGRTGADDPRLTVPDAAAAFKAWFPGP